VAEALQQMELALAHGMNGSGKSVPQRPVGGWTPADVVAAGIGIKAKPRSDIDAWKAKAAKPDPDDEIPLGGTQAVI
jgi:hypothetical protein